MVTDRACLMVRIPMETKRVLASRAVMNGRSLNAEVVQRLNGSLAREDDRQFSVGQHD
jgi:predicted HicB family RNase H-like nuclease